MPHCQTGLALLTLNISLNEEGKIYLKKNTIVLDDEVALATNFTNVELIGLPVLRGGLWGIGDLLHGCRTL